MQKKYNRYTLFYGGVFSQWYPSPMVINGVKYGCAKQYMMAQKARVFGNKQALNKIMATQSPAKQKAIGRRVRGFNRRQ